jgi:oligopeptidase A
MVYWGIGITSAVSVVGLLSSSAVRATSGFASITPSVISASASSSLSCSASTSKLSSRAVDDVDITAVAATSAAAATSNPLLQQDGLPKFDSIQPQDLTPAVNRLLEELDSDFKVFESQLVSTINNDENDDNVLISYDTVVPVVEKMQYGLGYTWGIAGHLNGVKNGEELRTAYEENQPKVVQAMTQFSQSKPLYDALQQISTTMMSQSSSGSSDVDDDDDGGDDFETSQKKRAVAGSLLSMTLGGVGLTGEKKEQFNTMKMKLAELSTKFSNNVLDATRSYSLTITDPNEMTGVPASAKAMWANAHIQQSEIPAADSMESPPVLDPDVGPWRITHDMPSYIAAMQHLPIRSTREQIYRAYISRGGELMPEQNNVPLIYEILSIKQEMAKLLGFANHAEKSLASKMAPSVQAVTDLSDLILNKALPAAIKELDEITNFARLNGGEEYSMDNLDKLMPWDTTFWSERLKETKFDLTEEELRPYFALPNVLQGMFGLLERIFGVTVTEAPRGSVEVWHPDVQFFNVYDKESKIHMASFYLDPFSRPENKRGGAWMDVCIGKSTALQKDVPVAYLTCNGSPPVGDKPSLMTFREVETLFHETGTYLYTHTHVYTHDKNSRTRLHF